MILSVSRRTDIPNYYSEWFFDRIRQGFLYVRNPMNAHQVSKLDLSPEVVDCIVFWTKNPEKMLTQLDQLRDYMYYFQFTLTGYGRDIEPRLPDKRGKLIPVFQHLSEKIGKQRVVWRYDPILINGRYTLDYHLRAFEEIAGNLSGYTERVVISFLDMYAKTIRNTKGLAITELSDADKLHLAKQLQKIASRHHLTLKTCAEQIDLREIGIQHGSCIDKKLIETLLGCKLSGSKDKNQRKECGCLESIDVGAYNTCLNGCRYCYANNNDRQVKENSRRFLVDSPLLCGNIDATDIVTERKLHSLRNPQISIFDACSP